MGDIVLAPWAEQYELACQMAELCPLSTLHREDGSAEAEIEIAYRMAELHMQAVPSLACIHSFVIQVALNLWGRITPYANLKRLEAFLQERGFVFYEGRIYPSLPSWIEQSEDLKAAIAVAWAERSVE